MLFSAALTLSVIKQTIEVEVETRSQRREKLDKFPLISKIKMERGSSKTELVSFLILLANFLISFISY